MTAMQLASTKPPSKSSTWTSARTLQHFCPAIIQSDSVSIALDRRIDFSRIRDRITSCSFCLDIQCQVLWNRREKQGFEPSDLERGGCDWGELCGDGEDSVK